MKNLHVLPTEKPSRFYSTAPTATKKEGYDFGEHYIPNTRNVFSNHNIYITSDEEIKEGDWVIGDEQDVFQVLEINHTQGVLRSDGFTYVIDVCKKIILTTDQELINDGVQPIPDEFLEWFVKNPSCEEVDFVFNNRGITGTEKILKTFGEYEIIIPKEELLQGAILKLIPKSDLEPNAIYFSNERKEMLKLCPNGDIFVHGRLADNDKEVVDALREFLRNQSLI